jgi:hypothetical protein
VPKLLGIYERELHGAIEAAIGAQPAVIVNVGAADGYYAVGLKRRYPDATVIAYEADAQQRELLQRVAAANGVAVEIRGAAGPGDLAGASLVVMDCEGCERALHDFVDPGVGETIAERFAPTHDVRMVPTGPQPPTRHPLSERRPGPMRWAVMTPR